jgi:hypothetical protein
MGETEENISAPADAGEHAEPKKPVRGRPITKETARAYQISSTQAKRRRREARAAMLGALTSKLQLGDELVNAILTNDDTKMNILEKALRLVGLDYQASEEYRTQNLKIDAKTENKHDVAGKIEFVLPEKK